jgi:endonuclease/exonuclease/phosphatase family metal-dependent hydrolase
MENSARDRSLTAENAASFNKPIVVNRAPRARRTSRLRIVHFNAAGGTDLKVIETCLRRPPLVDANLILLCEADRWLKRSGRRDISADLAAALGMSCAYVPEYKLGQTGAAFMGNAILSSMPFESCIGVPMPTEYLPIMSGRLRNLSFSGQPMGIIASVRFGTEKLTIGLAHLHSRCAPAAREQQVATFMASFPDTGRALFAGDLNTTTTDLLSRSAILRLGLQMLLNPRRFRAPQRYEPLFERIRENGLEIDGANVPNRGTFTFSGAIPRLYRPKLDWIALRKLRPVPGTAKIVSPRLSIATRRASDHDFIVVDVEL